MNKGTPYINLDQISRRIPNIQFRILVIGRANAGKTTILQRLCDTTESPTIYRGGEEVSYPNVCPASDLTADQFKLEPSMNVSDTRTSLVCPLTSFQRGEHTIDDELVFSNHTGYVFHFHDSRGIECDSTEELDTLRDFIRRKCAERQLRNRLHAIWFAQLPFS